MDDPIAKHLDLMRMFMNEQIDLLKHYEESRTKISQIILALSAALVGLSRFSLPNGEPDTIGPLIIVLGLAGIVFSLKYTSLANHRTNMARAFRREIAEMFQGQDFADIDAVYRKFAKENRARLTGISKLISRIQVRWCWIALHASVILIGLNITF